MTLDPTFLREFTAYFNADAIDIASPASLDADARGCAGDLARRHLDTHRLRRDLSKFLVDWDPATLKQLANSTCVDWQFSPEVENALKQILTKIVSELGG